MFHAKNMLLIACRSFFMTTLRTLPWQQNAPLTLVWSSWRAAHMTMWLWYWLGCAVTMWVCDYVTTCVTMWLCDCVNMWPGLARTTHSYVYSMYMRTLAGNDHTWVELARTVYFAMYDRIFDDFPAKNTVYTPYIYGSGQPYTWGHIRFVLTVLANPTHVASGLARSAYFHHSRLLGSQYLMCLKGL